MHADNRIDWKEAQSCVDEAAAQLRLSCERLSVRQALRRILAQDVCSQRDLPSFNRVAMDGFAILSDDDNRSEFEIVETVAAGSHPTHPLCPGQAIRIMTGAPAPINAGRVVKHEDTEVRNGIVKILRLESGSNISPQGEDIKNGERALSAGTLLSSAEIASLIACGVFSVEVARKPKLVIISTGDEVVRTPEELSYGKILDTNGPMLAHMANEAGIDVVREDWVPDNLDLIKAALKSAEADADLVLLSGGVSAGEFDYVGRAIHERELSVRFSKVLIQPGLPTTFAVGKKTLVFGLPGNPVAVFLLFRLLVMRAVARMSGYSQAVVGSREYSWPLASPFSRKRAERKQFVPARLTQEGGLQTISLHGSAHLLAMVGIDGFFEVGVGVTHVAAGERVVFHHLR